MKFSTKCSLPSSQVPTFESQPQPCQTPNTPYHTETTIWTAQFPVVATDHRESKRKIQNPSQEIAYESQRVASKGVKGTNRSPGHNNESHQWEVDSDKRVETVKGQRLGNTIWLHQQGLPPNESNFAVIKNGKL